MRYRYVLLMILAMIGALNAAEVAALGLVMQGMKHDLSLTDLQLGMLTGFAFMLFYALAGLAIARWADQGNRVVIISLATALWAILLAAQGTVTNFWQLILVRVGLGIGEAGALPASQSLIADYFSRLERLRANAIYFATVIGIANLVGYAISGQLNELYGWRLMFMILAVPGLAMALLAWFTLREPRSEKPHDIVAAGGPARLHFKETLAVLFTNRTLRHLVLFYMVWGFVTAGITRWWPVLLLRSYGMTTGQLGLWITIVFGTGGTLGPLLGSAWCSRYAGGNERLQLRVMATNCCVLAVLTPFVHFTHNFYLCIGLLGLWMMLTVVFLGAFWSLMQALTPTSMRASAAAVLSLITALVGVGLGPLATGALSDALQARLGNESLLYASLALCPGFLWAAWHLLHAGESVGRDMVATQEEHPRRERDAHPVGARPEISC